MTQPLKILRATPRGQITLPKSWRDQFSTEYYTLEMEGDALTLRPLLKDDLPASLDEAWSAYQKGQYMTQEALMQKYGL